MPVVDRPGAAEEVERWWEAIFVWWWDLFVLFWKRGGVEACRVVTRVRCEFWSWWGMIGEGRVRVRCEMWATAKMITGEP